MHDWIKDRLYLSFAIIFIMGVLFENLVGISIIHKFINELTSAPSFSPTDKWTIIISVFALVLSGINALIANGSRKTANQAREVANLQREQTVALMRSSVVSETYQKYVNEGYIEGGYTKGATFEWDNICHNFREARTSALERYSQGGDKRKDWNELSRFISKKEMEEMKKEAEKNKEGEKGYPAENSLAYHTAQALEHIGFCVISGAIPLNMVLVSVADSIIDDWIICHNWVKTYSREDNKEIKRKDNLKIKGLTSYYRGNAEWIAFAALIWLDKEYEYSGIKLFKELYEDDLVEIFENISYRKQSILTEEVKRDVKELLDISI